MRVTTNSGGLYVRRHMISGASGVVIMVFNSNKNTAVSSTFLVTYLRESYRSVIVTNQTTTLSHDSNPLCN